MMKVAIAFAMLVTVAGFNAHADTGLCEATAIKLAQINLDSKANAYGFESSSVAEETLKLTAKGDDRLAYTIEGFIYKAAYTLDITMDGSCGVQSVIISGGNHQ